MSGRWGNRCRHERGWYSATEAINAVAPAAKSKELNPRATRLGIAASDHTCALAHVSVDRAGRLDPRPNLGGLRCTYAARSTSSREDRLDEGGCGVRRRGSLRADPRRAARHGLRLTLRPGRERVAPGGHDQRERQARAASPALHLARRRTTPDRPGGGAAPGSA